MSQITLENNTGGGLGMNRSKSVFASLSEMSFSSSGAYSESVEIIDLNDGTNLQFANTLLNYTEGASQAPNFHDGGLRKVMEPFLQSVRDARQRRFNHQNFAVHDSIVSSVGVPYTAMRKERVFLFDTYTHPLHEIVASALAVNDLAALHKIYEGNTAAMMSKLMQTGNQERVHFAYESFVNSFCVPLLHEMAILKRMLHAHSLSSGCIVYRYQSFPTIHIHVPGAHKSIMSPTCDLAEGHSIGCLKFHVPLTPSFETNALFVESHPGREDWHPLTAKSVGLGYLFDGSRCIHFDLENTTDATRVSLEFRVLIYRSTPPPLNIPLDDGVLTAPDIIEDRRSKAQDGYYDESIIDLSRFSHSLDFVAKKPRHVASSGRFAVLST